MSELVDRVRRRLVDDPGRLTDVVRAEAGTVFDAQALTATADEVSAELTGVGPLQPLLATLGVTDILVNGPDEVWFDRGRGPERSAVRFPDDVAIRRLAQRLAASAGRRLDDALPWVDAALPGRVRLHAALPPLVEHPMVCLRLLPARGRSLPDLVASGSLPEPIAELLTAVIAARLALVITGGTGTGKTTLLAALLGGLVPGERLVLIEDAPELRPEHDHVVRLCPRPANVEGVGEVGLRVLVRNALRMRPDRVVVGEFRGAEMVELLIALNTGHDGGAATMHANSAADVPARFAALGGTAGLGRSAVTALVSSAIDLVVHLVRRPDGSRTVAAVSRLVSDGEHLSSVAVWSIRAGAGPGAAAVAARLAERGIAVPIGLR